MDQILIGSIGAVEKPAMKGADRDGAFERSQDDGPAFSDTVAELDAEAERKGFAEAADARDPASVKGEEAMLPAQAGVDQPRRDAAQVSMQEDATWQSVSGPGGAAEKRAEAAGDTEITQHMLSQAATDRRDGAKTAVTGEATRAFVTREGAPLLNRSGASVAPLDTPTPLAASAKGTATVASEGDLSAAQAMDGAEAVLKGAGRGVENAESGRQQTPSHGISIMPKTPGIAPDGLGGSRAAEIAAEMLEAEIPSRPNADAAGAARTASEAVQQQKARTALDLATQDIAAKTSADDRAPEAALADSARTRAGDTAGRFDIRKRGAAQSVAQAVAAAPPTQGAPLGAQALPIAAAQELLTQASSSDSAGFSAEFSAIQTERAAFGERLTHVLGGAEARPVARQIAEASINLRDGQVELQLSPEELGRVKLSMTPGEAGLQVQISADRPETLDLLRRHIQLLNEEFAAMGLGTAEFSFGGSGASESDSGAPPQEIAAEMGEAASGSEEDATLSAPVARTLAHAEQRLDIRL